MNTKNEVKNQTQKNPWYVRAKIDFVTNRDIYMMALPVVLFYIIFCYIPMFGVIIAFKKYSIVDGIFGSEWVGLKYFKEFFGSIYFGRTMRNTLLISLYDLIFSFPAPIIFALLLNEIKLKRVKSVVQTVSYLPHFISLVVICGMIANFMSSEGIITQFISMLGGKKMNYLGDARYFRTIYISSGIWQSIGWSSIIYLAALSGIDQEIYEAAEVDGAGRFGKMWHVTLPGIIPTIMILLIMRVGSLLSVGYEKIILLYNSGTLETADVISSYVYRQGLGAAARYDYSTAVGIFQSVINMILLIIANTISKVATESSLF